MKVDRAEVFSNVLSDVFQKVSFMFTEDVPLKEMTQNVSECTKVTMSFTGEMTGSVELLVPETMCPEIAANMMGMEMDDELALERGADALKEILNIICGNLMTELAGEEPVIDITVPEISSCDIADWRACLEKKSALGFLVDDTPVILSFELKE